MGFFVLFCLVLLLVVVGRVHGTKVSLPSWQGRPVSSDHGGQKGKRGPDKKQVLPLKVHAKRPPSESIQVPPPECPPPLSLKQGHCERSVPSTGACKRARAVSGVSYTDHNLQGFHYGCRSLTDPPGCSVGLSSDWLVSGFQPCLLSYSRRHHVQRGGAA